MEKPKKQEWGNFRGFEVACEEYVDFINLVAPYPKGTAIIRYSLAGEISDWAIAATIKDNEHSLREHLKQWIPGAVFVGWEILPDKSIDMIHRIIGR